MNYTRYYIILFALGMHVQSSKSMDRFYNFIEHDRELFPQLSSLERLNGDGAESFSSEFPEAPPSFYTPYSMPATPSTPLENCYSAMVPATSDLALTPSSLTPCSEQENLTPNESRQTGGNVHTLKSPQANRSLVNKIIRDVQKRSQLPAHKTTVNQNKQKQQKKLQSTIKNISNQYRIDYTQQIKPMSHMVTQVLPNQNMYLMDNSVPVPNRAPAEALPTLPADSFVIVPADSFYYSKPLHEEKPPKKLVNVKDSDRFPFVVKQITEDTQRVKEKLLARKHNNQ